MRVGVADNFAADRSVTDAFEGAVGTIRELGFATKRVAAPLTDFGKGVDAIETDRRTIAERGFADIDLMMLPTTPHPPPRVVEAIDNPLALSAELTMFANYFGLPAISVPCGFDARGLPLGLQIVGKPGDDISVLQVAYRYQNATRFAERHPLR